MTEQSNLEIMPVEILHKIFCYKSISHRDLAQISSTCIYFRNIVSDNSLWKAKFFQTWERLKTYGIYGCLNEPIDWREETVARVSIGNSVLKSLDRLAVVCRNLCELSNRHLSPFLHINHPRSIYFVIDILLSIVSDRRKNCNLTRKYYGLKVLRQLQQIRLKSVWVEIINKPEREQILEEGAFFLSQWQHPHLDVVYNNIRKSLDKLSVKVIAVLKEEFGRDHPLVKSSEAKESHWKECILSGNAWTPHQCKQIIMAAWDLLFTRNGFTMRSFCHNFPIDKEIMMKECDPLTLSIILEAVLRRLGVKCDLVMTSRHFFLRWCENYLPNGETNNDSTFLIDMNNKGFTMKNSVTLFGKDGAFSSQSSLEITEMKTSVKMIRCLMTKELYSCIQNEVHTSDHVSRLRSSLEMVLVASPEDLDSYLQLMDFYNINGIEVDSDLLNALTQLLSKLSEREQKTITMFSKAQRRKKVEDVETDVLHPSQIKHRSSGVHFTIGLVMQHKQYGYKCVVYGWDVQCNASQEWMRTMRVHRLEHKHKQPFYNVLVDDGSLRYAAQENLKLVEVDTVVNVPEVGKYFVQWKGLYYEPTPIKAAEYPDDKKARDIILGEANSL